ncbi:metal-dependent hydrolase family protein [Erythrobacter sp. WG]|uniref:metal-dependent hydrolase family protein n=1 Tax=Erythrobacter sp. WG TaxID=2985510 RepID=UPI00226E7090|nr:amidohydrolase family protein [Erythrobacter sp. WG]MCX9147676.1 amidohydrolase family protein [Erythrobacter sp. WG]
MGLKSLAGAVAALIGAVLHPAGASLHAQEGPREIVFRDVRVFDGTSDKLSGATTVVVRGNTIAAIGAEAGPQGEDPVIIEGRGRTLMPGMIDNHVHMMFNSLSPAQMAAPDMGLEKIMQLSAGQAQAMLLRGFTAVRDVGGPSFELKRLIDSGKIRGPRIWPSGPMISQTSGHADLRGPTEPSRRFSGKMSKAEEVWASVIADGRDEVLTAVRENLRMGASQIKIAAGGGTSSEYDPLDVTQYTLDEMKAAVDAAGDWNTYVTVHAYHPKSVRRAIEAGVKVIEHGNLLDEPTLKLMADKGIWLSGQMLVESTEAMDPKRREKRKPVIEGQKIVWPIAKRLGVKLAWGTDFLFEPDLNAQQNAYILRLKPFFTPAELLRLVTSQNAELLALSGPRTPYQGKLGVVAEGALADLILVEGDPLANIDLIGDPARNFAVIVKDGVIVKGGKP